MRQLDLTLDELVRYCPDVAEPRDFDEFWAATLDEADSYDLDVVAEEVETPYRTVQIRDVSFRGFNGDRISAWLVTPRWHTAPMPVVVEYLGYNSGRDVPGTHLQWASAGYAHLVVDTRGQGAAFGGQGDSPDSYGSEPCAPGFLTRGIARKETYYYRRVFTDAVRAISAARMLPGVNAQRVAVHGISQGGGIALAVAGLVGDLAAVLPDVPFLCHFRRAIEVSTEDPYAEIVRYLAVQRGNAERVLDTISYFDGVNFAKRATAPALFSVALLDQVCPPSTVFAAHNHYAASKELAIYPYNDHEGGQSQQRLAQILWLNGIMPAR